jgi:hypothetical protein
MKDLINRSYQSIRNRGLITSDTDFPDFIEKMEEELMEIKKAYERQFNFPNAIRETIDLMNVCSNAVHHFGYDVEKEFVKCIIHNETRKD